MGPPSGLAAVIASRMKEVGEHRGTLSQGHDLPPGGDVPVEHFADGGEADPSSGGPSAAAEDVLHAIKSGDAAGLASALGAFLDTYQSPPADDADAGAPAGES